MLDIKFIREHSQIVKDGAQKKGVSVDIDKLLRLDEDRRQLLVRVEDMRAQQNSMNATIAGGNESERESAIVAMRELKAQLKNLEDQLKTITDQWQDLMLQVPNVPDISVPEGDSDQDNVPIKHWGEKPQFSFEPKDHVEIMTALGIADFERGTKAHGFRGYYLRGAGATLSFAIWNYAMQFFGQRGFVPFIPPIIMREENFYGTGHLPNDAEDLYRTQDNDFLAGTAEVPLMGYHRDEVLPAEMLPIKYLGFSPCYRREAGSHGKDVKGLIRVHEFYKIEQVLLCEANHQTSVNLHEEINRNTEEFIESLGIPYRTVVNCGGDLGLGQVKKYDIELWVPLQGTYREISSASYFHDFQSRRFNIRYRDDQGLMRFAHSLNCTAIPTPRILVSLIENFQQADGSVIIPEPLRPYMGMDRIARESL